jgi:hypothetical protein
MASVKLTNNTSKGMLVPEIGRSGSAVKLPASSSITINADDKVTYSTSDINTFYTDMFEGNSNVTVETVPSYTVFVKAITTAGAAVASPVIKLYSDSEKTKEVTYSATAGANFTGSTCVASVKKTADTAATEVTLSLTSPETDLIIMVSDN